MTDAEIPKICRDCKHCKRWVEISDWMPHWLPWKYTCEFQNPKSEQEPREWSYEKDDYICKKKEIA